MHTHLEVDRHKDRYSEYARRCEQVEAHLEERQQDSGVEADDLQHGVLRSADGWTYPGEGGKEPAAISVIAGHLRYE